MIESILYWTGNTFLGQAMRDIWWMWLVMESLHFIALSVMFGALLAIDLRVLGVTTRIPMNGALKLIPLVLIAFCVALLTGTAFFSGDPQHYAYNSAFQWKIALILIAGANALWFWFGEHKKLAVLGQGEQAVFSAKLIAAVSLALWVLVIFLGRMIPYFD